MDVPPTPPTPTPQTPYRAGKALAEIIPPDRRRLKAAVLVVSSMIAGVAVWEVGGFAVATFQGERLVTVTPQPVPYVAGRVGPALLHGPEGTFTLPPAKRAVVNVWLQGCSDCMPAFEAMAKLQNEGGLGVSATIINVAYGEADTTWARRYGVANGLVFDPGGTQVVKPLGIGTFTSLVVEPDGSIIHRDRPDRPGYAARMRTALASGAPITYPITYPTPESEAPPVPPAPPLRTEAVQRVVASHTAGIRRACWERAQQGDGRRVANVTATLTITPDGTVRSAAASGDDPVVARCIEDQTRTWLFPAPGTETTVNIPFKFVRE